MRYFFPSTLHEETIIRDIGDKTVVMMDKHDLPLSSTGLVMLCLFNRRSYLKIIV